MSTEPGTPKHCWVWPKDENKNDMYERNSIDREFHTKQTLRELEIRIYKYEVLWMKLKIIFSWIEDHVFTRPFSSLWQKRV